MVGADRISQGRASPEAHPGISLAGLKGTRWRCSPLVHTGEALPATSPAVLGVEYPGVLLARLLPIPGSCRAGSERTDHLWHYSDE